MKQLTESELQTRDAWIRNVTNLISRLDAWAKELQWSTRRIDKNLDDVEFGRHVVPALLLQNETYRVLCEPIGRSAKSMEGIVDIYLLPAYDDIASLYYYDGDWHIHYMFRSTETVATIRDVEALPLTKKNFASVLTEIMKNASAA